MACREQVIRDYFCKYLPECFIAGCSGVFECGGRGIPPKEIPSGKIHRENSTFGKFYLWKIAPMDISTYGKFHPRKIPPMKDWTFGQIGHISKSEKNWKSIFHSIQHIPHLSCKFEHFKNQNFCSKMFEH